MFKFLSVVISLAFGFLLVEVGVRILMPSTTWKAYRNLDLGWAGDEYLAFQPKQDPPVDGQKRVLFLGDSFLAGDGLSDRDDRFPIVLGNRVGPAIRIQILASGGWGTDQELLAFMQKGRPWKPDLVILVFVAHNDLRNNGANASARGEVPKPYFVVDSATNEISLFDHAGKPAPWNAQQPDARTPVRSHLWDLLVQRFRDFADPGRADAGAPHVVDLRYLPVEKRGKLKREVTAMLPKLSGSPQNQLDNLSAFLEGDFETTTYAWKLLEAILARLHSEVEAIGAEFLVVLLPDTLKPRDLQFITGSGFRSQFETPDGPVTVDMSEPLDRLSDITKRQGIAFFDPTTSFIDHITRGNLATAVWPTRDNHYSKVGHKILADQLFEFLQDGSYLE